jgi:hypothetical protein
MSIYANVYYNLCNSKVNLFNEWKGGSGLHRHHIIPKHSGGLDTEDNYTYLTVREHTIAHFLLWKMHRNPNDLRAMNMLGANLSVEYRRTIGLYCRDNKIGIYCASKEQRQEWQLSGIKSQKESGSTDSFYYWSTTEGRKKRASMGGKVGAASQINNKTGIHDPANFKKNATIGGKAIKGMICVTNGTHRTRIRPEKLEDYLARGYQRGFTISSYI